MFGKARDVIGNNPTAPDIEDFFGDEAATDTNVRLDTLQQRVRRVEGQINSQFTSMAAYAQIAQEQIELVRSEARAETERTEGRLTRLVERERDDRIAQAKGRVAPAHPPSDIEARLCLLEDTVETIKFGINDCLSRQKALADAITALFESKLAVLPPPVVHSPTGGGRSPHV